MTTRTEFRKGDVLFRQDSTAEHVLRLVRGEVEVLREIGGASVVLGHVREGEWLGEMAVIENRSHSATAHATTDCVVESLTARQFLDQISSNPPLARDVILRLSVRLRRINDKVAGDMGRSGDIRTATGRRSGHWRYQPWRDLAPGQDRCITRSDWRFGHTYQRTSFRCGPDRSRYRGNSVKTRRSSD